MPFRITISRARYTIGSCFFDLGLIDRLVNELGRNAVYPHLYLELLACAVSDVVSTSQICCFEGAEQTMEGNLPDSYAAPYSFGSRVDQFFVLRDAALEAVGLVKQPFDKQLFATIYLKLCEKYMYLTTKVNVSMYLRNNIHPDFLHQAMVYVCGAGISMYPGFADIQAFIYEEIQKLDKKYEPYLLDMDIQIDKL